MGIFNEKFFNSEVFGKYMETVPKVKQNALLKAGVLRNRTELKNMLSDQVGGNYITVPMTGIIGGDADNYDGSTNINADGIGTYAQSMIVVGRAHAWKERDFSYDVTGKDFMDEIGKQVAGYWDDVDEATILAILEGIFGVSADSFNTKHTLDITADAVPTVGASTLNTAVQKAAGANKNIFTTVIMHSEVATNLENLQLLEYAKYTDAAGIQRDMALATWNGRTVLIDDDVPTRTVGDGETAYTEYTTYVLGANAFDYCDCGAKVAYEVDRNPMVNGGEDTLYTRQRKLFAPKGFSFVQPNSGAIMSPTADQLKTAARWTVVKDATSNKYFDSKAIPFARIISKG